MGRTRAKTGSVPPLRTMTLAVGHANPDFDAYAATVAATKLHEGALGVFLGTQNANVREFHNLHQDLLPFADLRLVDRQAVAKLVMVDTRDPERIGEMGAVAVDPEVEVVVYDHHPPSEGDLEGVEDRSLQVGAATSILVHEIRSRGIRLTPLEASLFLLGIHEDTGSLTYPGATAYDADAAAFLMAAGADMEVLNQFLSRTLSSAQRELLDLLTESLTTEAFHGQQVAICEAKIEEYVDSASVLTHHIVEDLGYRVAFAIVRMGGRTHVVGRSRLSEVDVGAVLRRLGGGGHPQAASAAIRGVDTGEVLASLRVALEAELEPPLRAGDIMSSPVRTLTPDDTMADAGELMSRWGHGGLPVVMDGRIVGLVTRKDVDKASRHRLDHAPVAGFMARDIVTVGPDVDLGELESLLVREGIGRVPVVRGGRLLGIVTRKDLLRAEHGTGYTETGVPPAMTEASKAFMASAGSLLPDEARRALTGIGSAAADLGVRAHVVGGFVRDMLLARRNLDIDVVIEGDGVEFALAVAPRFGARVRVHRRFGTAVLVFSRELHVDVASARSEYYARPGALPTVERSSLRQDLFRRDFSINAMAASIVPGTFGEVTDPFGGMRDIERGSVRALHSMSFVEDPTRVLRCARFAVRYGFEIDPATAQLAREAVEMGMIGEVTGARVREELLDILDEDDPAAVLELLATLGALDALVPEGASGAGAIDAVRRVLGSLRRLEPMFGRPPRRRTTLAVALGSLAGRREADRWVRRLRFGREYGEAVLHVAEDGERLGRVLADRRGMRDSRLNSILSGVPGEAIVAVHAAGTVAVRERIERYVSVVSRVRPAVSGDDLVRMGYEPSPAFAGILSQALASRLDERAVGREQELANLKRIAARTLGDGKDV